MYDKIYEFCKVKNKGTCHQNGIDPTPRVQWLINFIKELGIDYELDIFQNSRSRFFPNAGTNNYFNIVMKGTSSKMVVAHHDIVNPSSDNANDNSCSVINAIAIKKLMPEVNVILLDGEEFGGIGSNRASEQINSGHFGNIEWVLNLELTGRGGKLFFIGDYPGVLFNHIRSLFPDAPISSTPFNDAVIFRKNGIDSVVINPLPKLELVANIESEEDDWFKDFEDIFPMRARPPRRQRFRDSFISYGDIPLDFSILYRCHSMEDSLENIDVQDMKEFVEEVCLKILS